MIIKHNLSAMNAQRQYGIVVGGLGKATEKLSSGYKINRAADDAAGLAISEKMRKQIRGINRAAANAEDGISCVQTSEGALAEVQDMLQRMNELCVQAANGTNSITDRQYIQDEIDQLISEVDRVSESTKFNETYMLKGNEISNKMVYITDYSITYTKNHMVVKDLKAVPYKIDYEGIPNVYIAPIGLLKEDSSTPVSVDKLQTGEDVTNYLYYSGNADNSTKSVFRSDEYVVFQNAELNSMVAMGSQGKIYGETAATDAMNFDLSTNGIDSSVRANKELYIYDTATDTITRLTSGEEMTQYLKDDNTVEDRYRYVEIVSTYAQGDIGTGSTGIILSEMDYPGSAVQTVDMTTLANYNSYTDANGKLHYVLGSGTFKIDFGVTGVVLDVSGNVNLEDSNLQNISVECSMGTNLSVKNMIIDNSINTSQTGNGVGSAIVFKDGNNTINCYGNNVFNGGIDNYIFDDYNVCLAGCGILVTDDASITINGTDSSVLTTHGSTSNAGPYNTAAAIGAISDNGYSWSVATNAKVILNSGTINAYANADESIYAIAGSCSIGGSGVSTITVNGGILNTYGGQYAIRPRWCSGMTDTPAVNINIGEVNITGTYGIGIDGTPYAYNGAVNINGGNVNIETKNIGIYLHRGVHLNINGGDTNILSTTEEAIVPITATSKVSLEGGTLYAMCPSNRPAIGYHSYSIVSPLYADGVLVDGTGIDDGNGRHIFTYEDTDSIDNVSKHFFEDMLRIKQSIQKLYDADGNEVSAIALNKYFDENGHYTGGLFSSSQVTPADEVKNTGDNSIELYIKQTYREYFDDLKLNLHVGAESDRANKIGIEFSSINAASLGIEMLASHHIGIVDNTGDKATDAIDVVAKALEMVSRERSNLGAIQNRLEHTIKNLDNVVENTTVAESQIRDTDMAEEMVKYSNNNILQQAGQSMLAQANQSNQGVLSLIQ